MSRPSDGSTSRSRSAPALILVFVVTLAARLLALPGSTELTMDPDSAHIMNVARCLERGQGFSNPGLYPVWLNARRLPMPETVKEPGYPFVIAGLAPMLGGEFRAGVLISLLAGLVLTLATFALARNLGLDRLASTLSALLVAANPLSISMSVRVMVDSLFSALLTTIFALSAWVPSGRPRPAWVNALMGVTIGLAFMTRSQTLVALPAIALFMAARQPPRRVLSGFLVAIAAAIVTASPFLIRNLREFGTPFYSDVGSFVLAWPHVDQVTFSHVLDRPPPPLEFALHHVPQLARHMAHGAVRFAAYVLPDAVLGHSLWVVPFAAGLLLSLRSWRTFLPIWTYLAMTLGLILLVNWDERYFSSTVPLWALITAVGALWIARAVGPLELVGPVRGRHLLIAAVLATFAVQAVAARRDVGRYRAPEVEAAMEEGPFLRARLQPDEAVMVMTTSYYSWFADRPSVHLVVADEARFMEIVRRLRVRYSALPTSLLERYAARYPGGRLPPALVVDHVNQGRDVTVFAIRDSLWVRRP